jgi:hypothetical protein
MRRCAPVALVIGGLSLAAAQTIRPRQSVGSSVGCQWPGGTSRVGAHGDRWRRYRRTSLVGSLRGVGALAVPGHGCGFLPTPRLGLRRRSGEILLPPPCMRRRVPAPLTACCHNSRNRCRGDLVSTKKAPPRRGSPTACQLRSGSYLMIGLQRCLAVLIRHRRWQITGRRLRSDPTLTGASCSRPAPRRRWRADRPGSRRRRPAPSRASRSRSPAP